MDQHLSVRQFSVSLAARLDEMSPQELREWARETASGIAPGGRRAFLESLCPKASKAGGADKMTGILDDLVKLRRKLERAMEQEPEWGYGDDDEVQSFVEFAPELKRLFDRARAAFTKGAFAMAADAYRELFSVAAMEDEYGRSVGLPADLDAKEERALFLRAVVETGTVDRARNLLRAWGPLIGREEVGLADVFEITATPIKERDELLDGLILLLEKQDGDECDDWLRQAIRLRHGTLGLGDLARRAGKRRPFAWVDWVAAVAEAGAAKGTAVAVSQALKHLPERLSLRATIAEYGFHAAVKSKDASAALAARWECFCADRSVRSLLDLWDAAPVGAERREWMARAVAEALKRLSKSQGKFGDPRAMSAGNGFGTEDWPFAPDDGKSLFGQSHAVFYYEATARVVALARLLAGEWEEAWKVAKAEAVLGWSSGEATQPLVVPAFFAHVAKTPPGLPLPPATEELFSTALANSDDRSFECGAALSGRLRSALNEAMEPWKPAPSAVSDYIQVALRRVDAIVEAKHRGAYARAALLLISAVEMLERRGRPEEAGQLMQSVIERHRRKHAFVGEIRLKLAAQRQSA